MRNPFRPSKTTSQPPSSLTSIESPVEVCPVGIKTLYSPDHPTVDIVFVHGLAGNRERTWRAKGETEPWAQTLLPLKIPTARVMTFGYDARVVDWQGIISTNRIANHAWNLLTSVAEIREEEDIVDRPIIFVCHSLGGLVCEDALIKSNERWEPHLRSISQQTIGIAFLGTPHRGSGLARWAEITSRSLGLVKQTNTDIVQVLRSDSEVLARIQDSFHAMVMLRHRSRSPIDITYFYETLPMPRVGIVVPRDSASVSGYSSIGIDADHSRMTKFGSVDDDGFQAVCGELRRWVDSV